MAALRVRSLAEEHHQCRSSSLNLGCAEILTSALVREMLATDFARRYGTKGGYAGGTFLDRIEEIGEELACRIFNARFAILSPVTGHVAVMTSLLALTDRGDTIMSTSVADGGYPMGIAERLGLRVVNTVFDLDRCNLDIQRTKDIILQERPRLIFFGAPRYLFPHPVPELLGACRSVGASVCYDGSHPLGLIAGGQFHDPLAEGVDLLIGSTSKTLFGPARGIILVRESDEIYEKLLSVYKNFLVQSTYQLNGLVALVVALAETIEFGQSFARSVVANSQALARGLSRRNMDILGMNQGGSQSHQVLPRAGWVPSQETQLIRDRLQRAGILCDGLLRFGTQQLTRLGVTAQETDEVAGLIAEAFGLDENDEAGLDRVRKNVEQFAAAHRTLHYTFEQDADAFRYFKLD
jgi:glycine hydroxymethyltransferase